MIRLEVWGKYALFSRPELKVERVSYDVPTPSAARGLVESIYFHPGLKWNIRKIYVLSPIKFTYIAASQQIVQRAAMVLQDVHYVIEAEFEMTDKAAPSDNPGKFQDIITRRMAKGQCFHTPYFGCREFPANFRPWVGGSVPTIPETKDLGIMLYDFDYSDPANITPLYFHAKLENGVLNTTDVEVLR